MWSMGTCLRSSSDLSRSDLRAHDQAQKPATRYLNKGNLAPAEGRTRLRQQLGGVSRSKYLIFWFLLKAPKMFPEAAWCATQFMESYNLLHILHIQIAI